MPYIGKSPSAGVRQRYQYTATAGQTTFSGTDLGNLTLTYTDNNFVDVFQNGVLLKGGGTDYTATSGTSIVLATGASVSDVIEIIVYDVFSVGNFFNRTDSDSRFVRHDSATAGTNNFIAGNNAGNSIQSGGVQNIAIGVEAGTAITTGDNNVCVGYQAGDAISTGDNNIAIGKNALGAEDGHDFNIAIGSNALAVQNVGADAYNVAIGYNAGTTVSTGERNILVGGLAGDALTDADRNVAIGHGALSDDTQGSRSTAIGYQALSTQNLTSATDTHNTAVGYQAGVAITDGTNNTIFGAEAGITITSAASNTLIGHEAGQTTNSDKNTFVGRNAGHYVTSGSKNTILGRFNGNENGLDIRTSSNNIVLSDGDGNPRFSYQDSTKNWNINVPANSNNALIVNNNGGSDEYGVQIVNSVDSNNGSNHFINCVGASTSRFKVFTNGNAVNSNNSYGSISDEKLKENIVDSGSQWDDIKALRVRKFSMKEDKLDAPNKIGVIAQELEASGMNGLVIDTPDLDNDLKDLGTVTKTVNYSILYMKAVKALQEAMTRIEVLESTVKKLEGS